MPLPNFLIVGSQKSGTSWLHRSLGRSRHIFASEVKELNFFNQRDFDAPAKVAALREHFPAQAPGVRYYLESTPHYFRARPRTAENIRSLIGSPAMVAVFRDPVQRYESAYINHMMKGRFPYTSTIDELTDEYSVLSLGRYAEALETWWRIHPQLKPMIYDDLVADPLGFVGEVMDHLGLECDLTAEDLDFRANDRTLKHAKIAPEWEELPGLDPGLRRHLREEYAEGIGRLERLLGRDLTAWREG